MSKIANISIDLASLVGTLKFDPGIPLPRHDKALLERSIATSFLVKLSEREGLNVSEIKSSASDPPDVTFVSNDQLRGIELSELLPENRLEKDSIIRRLRRKIISRLNVGDDTQGHVVTINLANDYAPKMRLGRIEILLAETLTQFFSRADKTSLNVTILPHLNGIVTSISVIRENLEGEPPRSSAAFWPQACSENEAF